MKSRNPQAGFTIVEALVVLTVTTMMVLVITNYMMTNLHQSTLASQRATLLAETQQSLDLMANDIRLSSNADTNNRWPDANAPGGQFGWTSDSDTIVLATAAEDSNGNVIFSDAKNYVTEKNNIVYFTQNGTLYKRVIAANVTGNAAKTTCPAAIASSSCPADKELLRDVTEFNLGYMNSENQNVAPTSAKAVETGVKVAKKAFGQPINSDYTTRMVFRND